MREGGREGGRGEGVTVISQTTSVSQVSTCWIGLLAAPEEEVLISVPP